MSFPIYVRILPDWTNVLLLLLWWSLSYFFRGILQQVMQRLLKKAISLIVTILNQIHA